MKGHVRYSSRDDILPGLKDISRTIPSHNMLKSVEHLQILDHSGLALLLAELLDSPIQETKEIAKECVRPFLIDPKTNLASSFLGARCIQNQCATIVLIFCGLFRHATDDHEQQLYDFGRETLVSILKSIAFPNRNTSYLIVYYILFTLLLHRFFICMHKKIAYHYEIYITKFSTKDLWT